MIMVVHQVLQLLILMKKKTADMDIRNEDHPATTFEAVQNQIFEL